jgi:GT2 family glycosyltransferase
MQSRTAVVILNWNGRHFLEKFLPDVIRFSAEDAEIIVADNASSDDSITVLKQNFPSVHIIENKTNEGFTGGYNSALKKVSAEYYVLLNSDVEVTVNWLKPLVSLMDANPNIGACQPKILSYKERDKFEYAGAGGGFIDKNGYPFCRGRIFNSLETDHGQYNDERAVFWATGACMVVRSSVYHELGGLDENFFAHMEEIDLCWRMQRSGYQVYYCGKSTIYHVGGGTLPKNNPRKTYLNFRNNLLLVYKNAQPREFRVIYRFRQILDAIAACKFLITNGYADFKAVFDAHRDFRSMRKLYDPANGKHFSVRAYSFIYKGNIVREFYIRGRKTFASLKKWRPLK